MTSAFTLSESRFPTEFARFVEYFGVNDLHQAITRVVHKLDRLPPPLSELYLDRYFFHLQCAALSAGPNPYQLDISNLNAMRAANFIAGVNRAKDSLSNASASRLRSVILSGLKPDRDIRQFEHEIRGYVHFNQKGMSVTFADFEGLGQFDLECRCPSSSATIEVECKTITEDTGAPIKTDLLVVLGEEFFRAMKRQSIAKESGVFVLQFKRLIQQCKDIAPELRSVLGSFVFPRMQSNDFDLDFEAKPEWTGLAKPELSFRVPSDLEKMGKKYVATQSGDKVVALLLRTNNESRLSEKITAVLKEAADQCTKRNPALIWMHLIGHREADFIELARHSQGGRGLNVIVANALLPSSSTTIRSHIHTVRFSADAASVTRKPVLDASLLIQRAGSIDGTCYDIPNPYCTFKEGIDF